MNRHVTCRTQAELNAVVAAGDYPALAGAGRFTVSGLASVTAYDSVSVRASDSASVTAYGSASVTAYDSASVTASGSASVRAYGSVSVRAYDSASVTAYGSVSVRAFDSASVTASGSASVTAYDSASVTASGSASVRASGSVSVTASGGVPVLDHGSNVTVSGGVLISARRADSPEGWCDFYGVHVVDGIAVLFKAVDDDWKGANKTAVSYEPGGTPAAPDWDPAANCGFGLHFSPHPWMAEMYNPGFTRYVACPVAVADLVVLGDKVKAPRCAGPVFECDIDGSPVVGEAA